MNSPTPRNSLQIRRDGDVLIVVNSDPATRNSLTPAVYDGLRDLLEAAGADERLGAIVLTGAGGFFCSGGNVAALRQRTAMDEAGRRAGIDRLHALISAIRACPKPVIAAVEGGAAGAGVSLALACDMIVSATGSAFSLAYVEIGLPPDGGATHFLARSLPRQLVGELCLTGDGIAAERLYQLGLVNRVTGPGEALEAARELARRLADGPSGAMARIKQLVDSGASGDLESQLELEARSMAASFATREGAEGIAAFLEKRRPDFRPRTGDRGEKNR